MKAPIAILGVIVAFFAFVLWQQQSTPENALEEGYVALFDGHSLEGWYPVGGESTFRAESGEIIGTNGPGANTFLRTENSYSDFVLKLEFRWDELGNSGIMFRGKQRDSDGRVYGYQSELDHSDRAWSGGIYDEARRGWLNSLEENEAARNAIKLDDWNQIRIEARGASLKTFVNDVPAADLVDGMDASGFIALQVHSGGIGIMRWRNIRIQELPAVSALGIPLIDDAQWLRRNIEDFTLSDTEMSGFNAGAGQIASRRQLGDFQADFELSLCETPHVIKMRERSMEGHFAQLSINAGGATAGVSTELGVREFEALNLDSQETVSVRLVALGDTVVISVGEQDVLRLADAGLPDRGRLVFEPATCEQGLKVSNFSWTDLVGGNKEIKFYQTLDTEPAPMLSPEQALADFVLPEGFEIELVAAEPLVEDPVAMAWDEYGRLYVVEMRGFMPDAYGTGQELPVGRVVRLEDTDGDGQMDTSEVFLDGLVNPRAVAVTNDGILIGEPPHLWLCELPSRDAVCTNKRSLGGYGLSEEGASIEHLENGLMPGLDNWLVNSKSSREFLLKDGELEIRESNTRGQWGISKDNFGRIYSNHNSNFITADFFAADDLVLPGARVGARGLSEVLTSPEEVFSIRVNPGVNRAYLDETLREDGRLHKATAVSGLEVYRGDQFPEVPGTDVFVPEPGANVVAQFRVSESGLALTAEHILYEDAQWGQREFLASTDERFRPVDAHNGPDGALYIIDMYRGIIQEQNFLTEELREQIFQRQLDRPLGHGRIWRVRHQQGKAGAVTSSLGDAASMDLVISLFSPNGWVRDTAQRLLIARPGEATQQLHQVLTGESTLAAIHALWALQGRGELSREMVLATLAKGDSARSQQALRAGHLLLTSEDLLALDTAKSDALTMQLAFALGDHSSEQGARAFLRDLLVDHSANAYVTQAIVRASRGAEMEFLQELLVDERFTQASQHNEKILAALAASAYRSIRTNLQSTEPAPEALFDLLEVVAEPVDGVEWQQLAMLKGLHHLSVSSGFQAAVLAEVPAIFADATIDEDSPLWDARLQGRRAFTWPGDEVAAGIKPLSPSQLSQMEKGAKFYAGCATCHGGDGKGVAGLAPALLNSPWVIGPPEWLARIILQGMTGPVEIDGEVWNGVMPPHGAQPGLDDETLAGLMIHLRRSWGHTEDPVSVEKIRDIRAKSASRTAPWTVAELEEIEIDKGYGRFAGAYKVSFITFTVTVEKGDLYMSVPMYGGGKMEPESETVFSAQAGDESVRLEFIIEEDGSVNKMIVFRDGQKIPVTRVPE